VGFRPVSGDDAVVIGRVTSVQRLTGTEAEALRSFGKVDVLHDNGLASAQPSPCRARGEARHSTGSEHAWNARTVGHVSQAMEKRPCLVGVPNAEI
jgi:hypothetical protein